MKYYVALESPTEKGLQIKVGDCVYIYRQNSEVSSEGSTNFLQTMKDAASNAINSRKESFDRRHCIIIRIQNLAIVKSTNQRLLYGHHYIWPSETFHEPSRKFYQNEVLRSPLCEWAALEEVRSFCSVLDPNTYIKGRPKGFKANDIFVCEYRVDRSRKSFNRITKHFPTNIYSYAFDMFETKMAIKRTYSV